MDGYFNIFERKNSFRLFFIAKFRGFSFNKPLKTYSFKVDHSFVSCFFMSFFFYTIGINFRLLNYFSIWIFNHFSELYFIDKTSINFPKNMIFFCFVRYNVLQSLSEVSSSWSNPNTFFQISFVKIILLEGYSSILIFIKIINKPFLIPIGNFLVLRRKKNTRN